MKPLLITNHTLFVFICHSPEKHLLRCMKPGKTRSKAKQADRCCNKQACTLSFGLLRCEVLEYITLWHSFHQDSFSSISSETSPLAPITGRHHIQFASREKPLHAQISRTHRNLLQRDLDKKKHQISTFHCFHFFYSHTGNPIPRCCRFANFSAAAHMNVLLV